MRKSLLFMLLFCALPFVCVADLVLMKNGKPEFYLDTCIRCYCCQEHCPKGAIQSRKTFLMKSLEWMERTLIRRTHS